LNALGEQIPNLAIAPGSVMPPPTTALTAAAFVSNGQAVFLAPISARASMPTDS
jgi:hypothetical protein